MATTTPNYLWSVPTSSDLVKNGATAIETLGDSVDASLWNSGYGQAGKNKIINGDFTINQRAFTTTTTSNTYGFDRFVFTYSDGTSTNSAQTFTTGSAPVAGYEAANFSRTITTGQTLTSAFTTVSQRIENVRTLAGQPVTVSFYAKAATGTPKIGVELAQNFGSGGSPSAQVNTLVGTPTITTAWVRYSVTTTLPSISGKTIGTTTNGTLNTTFWLSAGSDFNARTGSVGIQTNTFDIWGVQVEYGSTATPFQTASGGSLQGELAMCQRYYYRFVPVAGSGGNFYGPFAVGGATSTTNAYVTGNLPVALRSAPTISRSGGQIYNLISNIAATGLGNAWATGTSFSINVTVASGLVLNQVCQYAANNSASDYLDFSAEL
jgi:hypothetical protein